MARDPRRKGRPKKPADVFKEAVERECRAEASPGTRHDVRTRRLVIDTSRGMLVRRCAIIFDEVFVSHTEELDGRELNMFRSFPPRLKEMIDFVSLPVHLDSGRIEPFVAIKTLRSLDPELAEIYDRAEQKIRAHMSLPDEET